MFTVTNETFGRLRWNISQEVSYGLAGAMNYANIVGVIYELSVIIFFLVNFCKRKSHLRTPYFVIYTIGCVVDVLPKFMTVMVMYVAKIWIFMYPGWGVRFYNSNFMYLWNLILAFNRFTAIFLPLKYDSYWSRRNTSIVIAVLCSYPFLSHIFNYEYIWCQFTYLDCFKERRPVVYTEFEQAFGYISDITYAIAATIFGLMAVFLMLKKESLRKNHQEKILLVQTILSSIFLLGSTLTLFMAQVNGILITETGRTPEMMRALSLQLFFSTISQTLYNMHHYLGLVLLMFMSEKFRNHFLQFYRLKCVSNRVANMIQAADNVSAITVLSKKSDKKNITIF